MAVTAASLKVVVGADTKDAESGLKRVGGLVSGFGKIAAVAGTALVAGLAVGFGASINAAASFEQTLSGVQAVSNATAGEMAQLRTQALALGQDVTLTGISAQDAAKAMEELSKGGVSVADQLGGATRGALLLASAGGLDVARAAEIAADSMNIFGLAGGDVVKVADLFAAAANSSSLEVSDLAMSMSQGGQVAHQLGFSIQDTTAAFAAFGAAGLKGSDAGTSLKTALLNLTNPTDKARAVMEQYGLSFFDANGKMLDFQGIAGQLQTHLKGLTDQQRLAALETIFGADAVRVASILYNEGADGIAKWNEQVGQSGAAAAMGAKRNDNLRGSIEQLKSSWETAQIALGTAFLPLLRQLVDQSTAVVNAAIPLINVLGPRLVVGIQAGARALVGFAGAFGALATAFKTGDFNRAFGPFITAISDAFGSATAGKVTLFVSALLRDFQLLRDAIITAGQAFSGKWLDSEVVAAPVRQIGIAFSALGTIVRPVVEAIRNPLAALATAFSTISEKVPILQGPLTALFTFIAQNAGTIGPVVAGFVALGPALTILGAILPAVVGALTGLGPIIGFLASTLPILGTVIGALGLPLTALIVAVGALAVAWSQNWFGIRDQTAGVVAVVQGFIQGTLLPALQTLMTFVTGTLVPGWAAAWAAFVIAVAPVTATILPALQTMWAGIVAGVQAALPGLTVLAGGFLMLAQAAAPVIAAIAGQVLPVLAELGANLIQFGATVIPQFAAAFAAVAEAVGRAVGDIATVVGATFAIIAGFVQAHGDLIISTLSGAWTFVSNLVGANLTIISGLISAGLQAISGDWSGAWETLQATAATAWGQIQAAIGGAVQMISGEIRIGLAAAQDVASVAWSAIQGVAQSAWNAIVAAVQTGVGNAVAEVGSLRDRAIGALGDLSGALFGAGQALIQGFISGVESMAGAAASAVKGVLSGIGDLLPHSEPKDPTSPLRGLADSGRALVEMFAAGIGDAAPEAVKKALEVVSAIANALKSGVEALTALATFKPPHSDQAGIFAGALVPVVQSFVDSAAQFEEDGLKAAGTFADAAGKVVGVVKNGVDALNALADFVRPTDEAIGRFKFAVEFLVRSLGDSAATMDADFVVAAAAWSEGAGKALAILKAGVDGLTALVDFKRPTDAAIGAFKFATEYLVQSVGDSAAVMDADFVAAAGKWSEAAGKALALLGNGVKGLSELADFQRPTEQAIGAFKFAVEFLVQSVGDSAAVTDKDFVAAAAAWSDGAGKALAIIGNGVDGLTKLADFVAPSDRAIDAFAAAVSYLVRRFGEVAVQMGTEGVAQAGAFGTAANSALTAAKTGIDAFVAMGKLSVPSREAIDQLLTGIQYTVGRMGQLAGEFGTAGLAQAVAFATAAGKVFTTLKDAVDLMVKLEGMKKLPGEAIQTLLDGVKLAVAKAGDLVAEAQELERRSIIFAGTMARADGNFAAGMGGKWDIGDAGHGPLPAGFPALAAGGIVTRPTLARLGESGPEAVIPLPRLGATGAGSTVNINFYGDVYGSADFDRRVAEAKATLERRGGW
jgi:TP901 family phage tail tape measure protein